MGHSTARGYSRVHRGLTRQTRRRPARTYLCRTVEPAARGATALLGERPEEPTLVALGLGPGCGERREPGRGVRRRTQPGERQRLSHLLPGAEPHHGDGGAGSGGRRGPHTRSRTAATATSLPAAGPAPPRLAPRLPGPGGCPR